MTEETINNKPLDLLGVDYYSRESALKFWSVSQVKAFRKCEARAMAELLGEWKDDTEKTPLLVGNFVHSYFESKESHEAFLKEHENSIFKKNGDYYAPFVKACEMVEALESDENFTALYVGNKEVAITGDINGVAFKGKIDCLNVERGYFVDIKTTREAIDNLVWVELGDGNKTKMRWFEAYGYILQMAVYQKFLEEMYKKPFEPIIYAVTKETPCDTRAIRIQNRDILGYELSELSLEMEGLDDVKKGRKAPRACGACEYCRKKKLTKRVEIY